ncbi:hypothetical protein TOPH_03312 [Tolypocladium ophioglossoides CBS 100239]|uniref:Uncharacterized protein n=1 Tax=Tolypocladium ophioglossoides (strain CBS 100239) TaxID=1163406 RepID=A0A0L0ND82_TOLOC|nr:hypothetical protein TOPH_03312 [Tolypocladium ophioglossoides CBS 100239]
MSPDPQLQSPFVATLPREIRDLVYLELWRSHGLRQHIFRHGGISNPQHICHWPCITAFQVEDKLQEKIEELRCQLGVTVGHGIENTPHCRHLQSPWLNHWMCGQQAETIYGIEAVHAMTTSATSCWRANKRLHNAPPLRAPYIPMLLSCKIISSECLRSIYESTTFIFTDMLALPMFVGFCDTPPPMKPLPTMLSLPLECFKYTRSLELSLSADFPIMLPCANALDRRSGHPHDVYDFHWLRLDQFQNLSNLNIWIAARGNLRRSGECYKECDFVCVNQLDIDALRRALASFSRVDSVTLSTPLGGNIGPEDGYVEGIAAPGIRVWKRGTGDRFHPTLIPIELIV